MRSITPPVALLIAAVLAAVLVAVYLVYGRRAENTPGCPRSVPGITRKFTGDTVEFDYIVDKQLYTGTFKKLDDHMIYDQTIMVTIVKQRGTSSPYTVLAINYMMPIVVMGKISEIDVAKGTKKDPGVVIKFINPVNEVQTITWETSTLKLMKIPAKVGNTVPVMLKCMTNVNDLDSPLLCLPLPFDYRSYG